MDKSSEFNIFKDFLRKNNYPLTQPRKLIFRIFLQTEGHIDVQELYGKAKKKDRLISLSTVYRTMHLLVECGLASENTFGADTKYFEKVPGKKHHDHLVCTLCRKVEEFHHPLIEASQKEIAKQYQFLITSHEMTLFGTCSDCE
jgi:Fur family ferric uptake transcriptional regulator